VYRVSQSGQETEETHLSDTLVNYSNDPQVIVCRFRFLTDSCNRKLNLFSCFIAICTGEVTNVL